MQFLLTLLTILAPLTLVAARPIDPQDTAVTQRQQQWSEPMGTKVEEFRDMFKQKTAGKKKTLRMNAQTPPGAEVDKGVGMYRGQTPQDWILEGEEVVGGDIWA